MQRLKRENKRLEEEVPSRMWWELAERDLQGW
jgi:hypothetical protein